MKKGQWAPIHPEKKYDITEKENYAGSRRNSAVAPIDVPESPTKDAARTSVVKGGKSAAVAPVQKTMQSRLRGQEAAYERQSFNGAVKTKPKADSEDIFNGALKKKPDSQKEKSLLKRLLGEKNKGGGIAIG